MSPTLLEWWGWLLCGLVAFGIGAAISDLKHAQSSVTRIVVGFIFILAAVTGFALGVVELIKRAWA